MSLAISLPPDVRELATLQANAEADAHALAALDATAELADLDAFLTDVVTRKDAAVAMRQRVVGPAKTIVREVESWFRPLVQALESAERHLKGVIGAKRLAAANAEREARELAAKAADQGDADALLGALAVASAAGAKDEARATTRFVWRVKRITADMLPDEWWCPDEARIAKFAADAPGDGDAPVIPGVVFEREAIVGARR
jgi:hypothetical protein